MRKTTFDANMELSGKGSFMGTWGPCSDQNRIFLTPFDVKKSLGPDWFLDDKEYPKKILSMVLELNPLEAVFKNYFNFAEISVDGEELVERARKDVKTICLGASAFESLWLDHLANRESFFEYFYETKGIENIYFPADILCYMTRHRGIPFVSRISKVEWCWRIIGLSQCFSPEMYAIGIPTVRFLH